MRYAGHNVLAIIVAAIVMYAIGALIYGVVFAQAWQAMTGITMMAAGEEWRMALSPLMPLLQAIGLSLVIKWRAQPGMTAGAVTGFMMALFFVFASNLYFVAYYQQQLAVTAIDALHLFTINIIGGAIIGAWK